MGRDVPAPCFASNFERESMEDMEVKGTNVKLRLDVWKRVRTVANTNHRTVTNQIEYWTLEGLEEEERKNAKRSRQAQ